MDPQAGVRSQPGMELRGGEEPECVYQRMADEDADEEKGEGADAGDWGEGVTTAMVDAMPPAFFASLRGISSAHRGDRGVPGGGDALGTLPGGGAHEPLLEGDAGSGGGGGGGIVAVAAAAAAYEVPAEEIENLFDTAAAYAEAAEERIAGISVTAPRLHSACGLVANRCAVAFALPLYFAVYLGPTGRGPLPLLNHQPAAAAALIACAPLHLVLSRMLNDDAHPLEQALDEALARVAAGGPDVAVRYALWYLGSAPSLIGLGTLLWQLEAYFQVRRACDDEGDSPAVRKQMRRGGVQSVGGCVGMDAWRVRVYGCAWVNCVRPFARPSVRPVKAVPSQKIDLKPKPHTQTLASFSTRARARTHATIQPSCPIRSA